MSRRFACTQDDIEPGTSRTLKFEGVEPIALFRTEGGEYHATSDSCTHERWSLGEDGDFEDGEVTCPLHMARFDIRTGAALCFPATLALTTYPVEVDGNGAVFVEA